MARKLDCDRPVSPRHLPRPKTAALDPHQTGDIGGVFRVRRHALNSRMMQRPE